ncbi:methyl-accepting chemotaxis protein [Cyanobium sp. T1B-Tous]|uniref:methyl-accepting chemotaxis protein n=1 Tax=Cyanobium sp. T1B-Tous TaxID=2823721 RepID=UPI0020CE5121|nr:methyl-accepting chemotaxis protein [Cyanobium sp. T1B-Tous]MCP9807661.1 methyl-accepting chemotaxis protein [Cyanobium sp. T1B-Tous]
MAQNQSMEGRLKLAFFGLGGLAFAMALLGLRTTLVLSDNISEISEGNLPQVEGLWMVNEGQTRIRMAKLALMQPDIRSGEQSAELRRIDGAWKQINEGFQAIEGSKLSDEDKKALANTKRDWDAWASKNEQFMQLYPRYMALGNGAAMGTVAAAAPLAAQLRQELRESAPQFKQAEASLLAQTELNHQQSLKLRAAAESNVKASVFWSLTALVLAPAAAVALSIYFSRSIARPLGARIARVVTVADQIAQGDLTGDLPPSEERDELGTLQNACRAMSLSLSKLVRQIQTSGIQITTSATQIAASGKELEATVAEQLASTNEVSATAQQIAATSRVLVHTMDEVDQLAQDTATSAARSQTDLNQMETLMRQLAASSSGITAKLDVMNEKATNINSVVTTITKVADQTNLLSLNAAIEAEKAGEYGSGFAVVAREIRRLADQTAVATLEIEAMVKEMQGAVSMGVMEMNKFSGAVNTSLEDVVRISDQVEGVIVQVQGLSPRFQQVGQSIGEQSQGAQQISEAMQQLTQASQQTADAINDTNRALEQLDESAHGLRSEISRFQVSS